LKKRRVSSLTHSSDFTTAEVSYGAHTHASTTRFAREREEEGEEEREGEEKKRNETDRKRERERERRIAFFKKEEGKIINNNKNTF